MYTLEMHLNPNSWGQHPDVDHGIQRNPGYTTLNFLIINQGITEKDWKGF